MACCNPNIVAETISQCRAPTGGTTQHVNERSGVVAPTVGGKAQVGGANCQFGGRSKYCYCEQIFCRTFCLRRTTSLLTSFNGFKETLFHICCKIIDKLLLL